VVSLALLGAALGLWASSEAGAQEISGRVFEDRNADGVLEPDEPLLPGVTVRLVGRADGGIEIRETLLSDGAGSFAFPAGAGCFLLQPVDPAGWRFAGARADGIAPGTPGYLPPHGQPRFSKLDQGIANLDTGSFVYAALGDSIGRNFALCALGQAFLHSEQVRTRLECTNPNAIVTLEGAAMLGEHTDDLLVDDQLDLNNVFAMIGLQPQLITLSMIGNDLLDVDPEIEPLAQEDVNRAVAEILDARRNLQEALSVMTSEIPGADIVLNTLYDNEADDCATTDFHRAWIPIVGRILRDVAWGQIRRISINEVAAEFAHEDHLGGCTGFEGMICKGLGLDEIHPNVDGYEVVREKLWEAAGGVSLGTAEGERPTLAGVEYGFLRRVRRLLPTTWGLGQGAAVENPGAAMDDRDDGAPARIRLDAPGDEFRLWGFQDWFDEIQIVRVVAGVRYRTTGVMENDAYRVEASLTGQFEPGPGFAYTTTNWNFHTPIVGGGGPDRPLENPDFPDAQILAVPDVPVYRDVSASLTGNPTIAEGEPDYRWPPPDHADLATTTVRVVAPPGRTSAPDPAARIELDQAWLDLYGWERPRPPEVGDVRLELESDGTLVVSFDPLPGAERYNLYLGRLSSIGVGAYDHGGLAPAGPLCDGPVETAGGRLEFVVPSNDQPPEDLYLLVTAHVGGVESPGGFRSDGVEIDRSQSICR
jgi:hypothetical protein